MQQVSLGWNWMNGRVRPSCDRVRTGCEGFFWPRDEATTTAAEERCGMWNQRAMLGATATRSGDVRRIPAPRPSRPIRDGRIGRSAVEWRRCLLGPFFSLSLSFPSTSAARPKRSSDFPGHYECDSRLPAIRTGANFLFSVHVDVESHRWRVRHRFFGGGCGGQ